MALGASLVSLSACGMYGDHAMPTGYTYHHEEYKSPATKPSTKVTVEQKEYMDAMQAEQFRNAVYTLLERLTMRAGMPPKPVYISTPQPMTTFYANIDNDLRESMRHIGYALSDSPQGAYVFTYEAWPLTDAGSNNVQIALRVFESHAENARQLTEETGQYFIQGADVLEMGSANQGFLKPHNTTSSNVTSWDINQAQPQTVVAPAPVAVPKSTMQPVVQAPVVRVPVAHTPVVRAPVVQPVAQAAVTSAPKAVVAPVNIDSGNAPRGASMNENAGRVSKSLTSYADQRAPTSPRGAIKVINHGDKVSASTPMVKAHEPMVDNLPSLEEIEAQINMLDAQISGANQAEKLIRSRVSR